MFSAPTIIPALTHPSPSLKPDDDLPLNLLEEGWRKCWSKTKSRQYFFNLKTGQTRWYLMEVVAATEFVPRVDYSEKNESKADYNSNTE